MFDITGCCWGVLLAGWGDTPGRNALVWEVRKY